MAATTDYTRRRRADSAQRHLTAFLHGVASVHSPDVIAYPDDNGVTVKATCTTWAGGHQVVYREWFGDHMDAATLAKVTRRQMTKQLEQYLHPAEDTPRRSRAQEAGGPE